jgi:uncharacterized SAM-binding protein YcdF (DUF218 family)
VDGILVLGGAIDPRLSQERLRAALGERAERLTEFLRLARAYPTAKLVYAGGSAAIPETERREADFAARLLTDLGVSRERLLLERNSRNTYENAAEAKRLVKPVSGETWILITSASHMPRAVGVFRAQRWAVLAYPVDFRTRPHSSFHPTFDLAGGLGALNAAAYEYIGLLTYWLRGRIDDLFPGPATRE